MLAYTYYYAYTKHIIHYTCEPTTTCCYLGPFDSSRKVRYPLVYLVVHYSCHPI